MKKTAAISAIALALGMGSALAADLPSRKAPVYVPPPPPMTWTGFYVGLNIGGGWSANNPDNLVSAYYDPRFPFATPVGGTTNLFFLPSSYSFQSGTNGGVVGGGQAGYNFQFNQSIVIGAEADFQGSSISGSGPGTSYGYPSPFLTPGTDFANSALSNIVDAHIKNLRKKIEQGNNDEFFETIRGVGYRIKE